MKRTCDAEEDTSRPVRMRKVLRRVDEVMEIIPEDALAPDFECSSPDEKTAVDFGPKPTEPLDVEAVKNKLLSVQNRQPHSQCVNLPYWTIDQLCVEVLEVLKSQDMMLELEVPLSICGDVHGQYHDVLRIFKYTGFPPEANYLFLGDYVDRGKRSLETIGLLFAYKIKYPENFFLLRGNHETPSICRIYGFYDECKQRYSVKLWKTFCDVFNWLPVCAAVGDRILCMHGGLSEDLVNREDADVRQLVNALQRPADVPDCGFLCDLLWSDPGDVDGFGPSDRGVSVAFGANVVEAVLAKTDMDLICRAHQVVEDGYEFFCQRKLVTLFSAPNYCGEFDNAAAVLSVSSDLRCSFKVLKPYTPGVDDDEDEEEESEMEIENESESESELSERNGDAKAS